MRGRAIVTCFAVLFFLLAVLPADAKLGKQRGWESLGELTVNDSKDHDTLAVTAAQGSFRAVKFQVFDHGVEFREVIIHFANGGDQKVELRRVIPAGGESRIIRIQGGDRVIRTIEFTYDAQSFAGKKARVKVLGRN